MNGLFAIMAQVKYLSNMNLINTQSDFGSSQVSYIDNIYCKGEGKTKKVCI